MTAATSISGGTVLVAIGNGATPEVFSNPCGLRTRGIDLTAQVSETEGVDCTNPDAATWVERAIKSFSAGVSGDGLLAVEAVPAYEGFYMAGVAKTVRVVVGTVGYFEGPFLLTTLKIGATNKEKATVSIELQSAGEVTYTSGVPS